MVEEDVKLEVHAESRSASKAEPPPLDALDPPRLRAVEESAPAVSAVEDNVVDAPPQPHHGWLPPY